MNIFELLSFWKFSKVFESTKILKTFYFSIFWKLTPSKLFLEAFNFQNFSIQKIIYETFKKISI